MELTKQEKIGWMISILVAAIIMLIPTSEYFTIELKMYFAATLFVICIMAFSLLPLLLSGLLLPVLYLIFCRVDATVALGQWTNLTVWLIVGVLIFASMLSHSGLLQRVAYWCIIKCGGNYLGVLYGVFIVSFIAGFVTLSNMHFVMAILCLGICKSLNLSGKPALAIFLTTIAGSGCQFVYVPIYLDAAVQATQIYFPDFTAAWYAESIYLWPVGILYWLLPLVFYKVFGLKSVHIEGGKQYFQDAYDKCGKMSANEKKCGVVAILLVLYLVTSTIHGLPVAWAFLLAPIIVYLIGLRDAKVLTDTNWGLVCFIVACLSIGSVGNTLGLSTWMVNVITPLLEGMNGYAILFIMFIIGVIGNFAMTPYSMIAGLAMPFAAICQAVNVSPMLSVMSLIVAGDVVFLPHEIAVTMLFYGWGMFSMSDFIKMETVKSILVTIVFVVCVFPWWTIMGWM